MSLASSPCAPEFPNLFPPSPSNATALPVVEAITQAQEKMFAGRGSDFCRRRCGKHVEHSAAIQIDRGGKIQPARPGKNFWPAIAGASRFSVRRIFTPRIGLLLGLTDPVCGLNMGETAELLAREFDITRAEQDAFALRSHQRAVAAREKLAEEICPVFPAPI